MPAQMQIDQAGLPAGTPGVARSDGLSTGALVTLTSLGGGVSHRFELLDFPDGDTTAEATLGPTAPTVWTFEPTSGVFGTYRIRLITDEGLPTESRQTRVFGIRLPNTGLLIPGWNEVSDPNGSRINEGPSVLAASENNEPTAEYPGGDPRGWFFALRDLFDVVDSLAGGGGPETVSLPIVDGETVSPGDAVSVVTPGSGPLRCQQTDASGGAHVNFIGIALTGGTGDFTGTVSATVQVVGVPPEPMNIDGLLNPGPVYLSEVIKGALTSTAPVNPGDVVLRVGQAYSITGMVISVGDRVVLP